MRYKRYDVMLCSVVSCNVLFCVVLCCCVMLCGLCRISSENFKCSGNTCRQHEM
nr:MAG TPA: hypothetical protein [Bacteriophage sp.]